jgi:uncharacterized protein YktB (UPF0637 family)
MTPSYHMLGGGVTATVAPAFDGFVSDDFALFTIPEFAPRMRALGERLRPRLEALAALLAPRLEDALGVTLYPHVAQHRRRSVNPPPETWAAFGPDPRRYKAYAHYAVGIDAEGVWLRLVLKDEAEADRAALARLLADDAGLTSSLPADMRVRGPAGEREVGAPATEREVAVLGRRRDASWSVGRDLRADHPDLVRAEGVVARAVEAFAALAPVWRRLPSSPWSRTHTFR